MKITATFSNGHVDVYKGKRDVKAAWMVIYPNGGFESGHSYDRASAEKTARSHISQNSPAYYPSPIKLRYAHTAAYWEKIARKQGKTVRQIVEEGKKQNAEFAAACKIEIVNV